MFSPYLLPKILATIAKKEKPDIIILGKQAIDDDSNQTGQMLSALMGWSQGTFACAKNRKWRSCRRERNRWRNTNSQFKITHDNNH